MPAPPMVLLVVGGGVGSFQNALNSLQNNRPVVVLADSGGAALDIYNYVEKGGIERAAKRQYKDDARPHIEPYDLAIEYLQKIKELGSLKVGVRQTKMLTFFSTTGAVDEGEGDMALSERILNAILSDCESTTEAVNHAVRWRNPSVIRKQLEESSENDPVGIAKAFQNALLGKDKSVIKVLIQYNVKVEYVSLKASDASLESNARPQRCSRTLGPFWPPDQAFC